MKDSSFLNYEPAGAIGELAGGMTILTVCLFMNYEAPYVPYFSEGFQGRPPIVSTGLNPKAEHSHHFGLLLYHAGDPFGVVRSRQGKAKNTG